MIRPGDKVRDKITGFEGVATARCLYMNGCIQIEVTADHLVDGKVLPPIWMDEQRVERRRAARKPKPQDVDKTPRRRRRLGGPAGGPSERMPPPPSHTTENVGSWV